MGIDPVAVAFQANQQQAKMQQAVQADIAHFQRLLYVQLAAPYMASLDPTINQEADASVLRELAQRAKTATLFIYEAQGVLKLDVKEPT
jgi:hypothetical protein